MSGLFPMVKGSWKLYLCSHRNLGGIVRIPAAASEAGEGCSAHLAGEQQRKGRSEWFFWWDISGKLDGPLIRKEENAHDLASTPETVA